MKTKLQSVFRKSAYWVGVILLGTVLGASLQFAKAWTEPFETAPGGNVGAPITTTGNQTKLGGLTVAGLASPNLEARWDNGTPYIDFSNDAGSDFDARIILDRPLSALPTELIKNDELIVDGASIEARMTSEGNDVAVYGRTKLMKWGLLGAKDIFIEPMAGRNLNLTDQWARTGTLNTVFGNTTMYGNVTIGNTVGSYTYRLAASSVESFGPNDFPQCAGISSIESYFDIGGYQGESCYVLEGYDSDYAVYMWSRYDRTASPGNTFNFDMKSGNVGIGTPASGYKLEVRSSVNNGTAINGVNSSTGSTGVRGEGVSIGVTGYSGASGSVGVSGIGQKVGVTGTSTSLGGKGVEGWGTTSDFDAMGPGVDYAATSSIRWKSNITEIDGALDKVLNMRGVYYDWDEAHGGKRDMGMIAEEVAEQVPEIVAEDENAPGYATGMDYGHLTPVLVEAIKEQQRQISDLKNQIEELKNK